MASGFSGTGAVDSVDSGAGSEPFLPHERLDVYRVALDFCDAMLSAVPKKEHRDLRDQLERASTSVILNIAEGAGRTALTDKRRFYEIAKGSATECAAILDVLRLRGRMDAATRERARRLAIRVVQMLSRLAAGPR